MNFPGFFWILDSQMWEFEISNFRANKQLIRLCVLSVMEFFPREISMKKSLDERDFSILFSLECLLFTFLFETFEVSEVTSEGSCESESLHL